MDHFEELQALRRELEQANYEYYVQDAPTMSDYDYDHKLRRLEELEGEHPELITPDSPTQRVGGKALESFQQVVHQVPLESLQDVFDYDELRQFDQRVRAAVPGAEYDVEPKVDGLSVALEYENGLFVRGATRGDGQVGEDEQAVFILQGHGQAVHLGLHHIDRPGDGALHPLVKGPHLVKVEHVLQGLQGHPVQHRLKAGQGLPPHPLGG